jgi:ABC-type Fe3+-siderophore transport system permease subunit
MKYVLYPLMMILNAMLLAYVLVMLVLYFLVGQADRSEFSTHPEQLILLIAAISAPASALVYGFRQPWK